MKPIWRFAFLGLILLSLPGRFAAADSLEEGWESPPREARLRAYCWWLNGCVTPEALTRDLEEMKAQGFGGALICDADGSSQDGNERAPHGPDFFSPEWRELFRHTLREANRLGLEMSLNIQSGWNLGGPMVPADDAFAAEAAAGESGHSERREAMAWLRERLAGGPLPASDVIEQAQADGIAERTLRRAFKELGGRSHKGGRTGSWHWGLPGQDGHMRA